MKKLESTFMNMVLSLVLIASVAAAALAAVFSLTEENIKKQEAEKQQQAISYVLPNRGEGAIVAAPDTVTIPDAKGDIEVVIYRAYSDSCFCDSLYIGAAVQTTGNGFGGPQEIMVGFDPNGVIIDYQVLKHQETPGLGDKIKDWFKTDAGHQNILHRQAGTLAVSKAGGDVDAITAATISSKAFLKAINVAYTALQPKEEDQPVEAVTSASQIHVQKEETEVKDE